MNRIDRIAPPNEAAKKHAQAKWNGIAKPLHSLGMLEEAIIRIAGIIGSEDILLDKRCVVDMCADNGVVCEGVTQTDSSVTAVVAKAMAEGTSNINVLADCYHADVIPVDIGMKADVESPNLICQKIAYGTENIAKGAAMTVSQAEAAITVGMDIVRDCKAKGYKIIVTGEMGIGNTTTSSAIASVLLNLPVWEVTGRGAGLDRKGLNQKIDVISQAIAVNCPDRTKPVELLARLGGYDIAGMTGLFLGGGVYHVPIVIDGFISAVSAALACELNPLAKEYMMCSHVSKEPAGIKMLNYIGLKPLLTAEMCLGEGTGGIMLLPLLDGALSVYNSQHRFASLPIEEYKEFTC